MTTDRGGLRFPIEVRDLFSAELLKFQEEIAASKRAFVDFAQSQSALGAASRRATAQSKARVEALTQEQRAQAELERTIDRSAVTQIKEALAKKKGLDISKQRLEAITFEQKVERELLRIKERSALANAVEERAAKQGIETSKARAAAAKAEVDAIQQRNRLLALASAARDQNQKDEANALAQRARLAELAESARKQQRDDERAQVDAIRAQGTELRKSGELDQVIASRRIQNAKQVRTETVGQTGQQIKLNDSLKETDSVANRISFSFRRLIGILALFQLARTAAGGFTEFVKSGFEFNQELEASRLGIAGIVSSVSDVRDEFGNLLEGADKFNAAQRIARDQQEKLRQEALATTATYQELLRSFQEAVGPGLSARLNIDQIRELSVLVSQALSATNQPQNQFGEEFRALVTGNIRSTTTRLAKILNLTNEDIRRFKQQGKLFDELKTRLSGFSLAAEGAAQTVGGLFLKLMDVIQLVAGRAATSSFETLRNVLQGLFDVLTTTRVTPLGKLLEPNPKAQEAFEAIFNAINRILLVGRHLASSIGLDGAVKAAELFATALETAGTAVVTFVAGVTRGLATLQTLFSPIISLFESINDLLPPGLGAEFLATLIQIGTVVIGLQLGFKGLFGVLTRLDAIQQSIRIFAVSLIPNIKEIVFQTKAWVTQTKIGAGLMAVLRSRAVLIGGAFTAVVAGVALLAGQLLDVSIQIEDLPELFGTLFEQVFTKIISFGDVVFTTIKVRSTQAFNEVVSAAKGAVEDLKNLFDLNLGGSEELARTKAAEVEDARRQRAVKLAQENQALELEIIEAKERAAQVDKDADKQAGDRLNRLLWVPETLARRFRKLWHSREESHRPCSV